MYFSILRRETKPWRAFNRVSGMVAKLNRNSLSTETVGKAMPGVRGFLAMSE
jgi:hypothetical protein